MSDINNLEVGFVQHILPQLISSIMIISALFKTVSEYGTFKVNHHQIGNFSFCFIMLLVGKIALFLFAVSPDIVKMYIDSTLLMYFSVLPLTLLQLSAIEKKHHFPVHVLIIFVLGLIMDKQIPEGYVIFALDMLMVFVALFIQKHYKIWFILSFLTLGGINLLNPLLNLDYTIYAWVEIPGQLFFIKGVIDTISTEKQTPDTNFDTET